MKRARTCRKCGCTERAACIEFDAKGRGYPCGWTSLEADLCTACVGDSVERAGPALVVAPQLAGYVARPR